MLNERVIALRTARHWSVAQLAIQAGLTRDAVHKIEMGARSNPAANTVAALARALDTTADYLLGLTSEDSLSTSAPPTVASDLLPLVERLTELPAPERQAVGAVVDAALDLLRTARRAAQS